MFSYTTFIVLINKVADISTNLLPPNFDVDSLTSQERSHREYGSKLVLVVEQCQILTVYVITPLTPAKYTPTSLLCCGYQESHTDQTNVVDGL